MTPHDRHSAESIVALAVERLRPGRMQPRTRLAADALDDLAASIAAQGVIQPLVVRPIPLDPDGAEFEIVAGERRWRAAQLAGLAVVPAVVRPLTDAQAALLALVENLQRQDLDPIETAEAIQRLMRDHDLTQTEVAEWLGLTREQVAHQLRLLRLDPQVKARLADGRLSVGHGKLLASLPPHHQRDLAAAAERHGWSVRRLADRIRQAYRAPAKERRRRDPDILRLENRLTQTLGARTALEYTPGSRRGSLTLSFHSLEELDGLLARLGIAGEEDEG
ncbi:MAG TPA: ParB/RepB/Spo0J family partition protein [Thiohalobacter sp.]|nr:ParB/RepB/Spo0J family partition protein [Thiohalobacter sp.]